MPRRALDRAGMRRGQEISTVSVKCSDLDGTRSLSESIASVANIGMATIELSHS